MINAHGEKLVFGRKPGKVYAEPLPNVVIPELNPPEPGFVLARTLHPFHTQTASDLYAHVLADWSALTYQRAGFDAQVRPVKVSYGTTYEVWVRAANTVFSLVHPQTTRDFVKFCWGRGANPRVYNPFIPYGFEEANKLDYFGKGNLKCTH